MINTKQVNVQEYFFIATSLLLMSILVLSPNVSYAFGFEDIMKLFDSLKNGTGITSISTVFGNFDGVFRVGLALTVMVARIISIYLVWTALHKLIKVSDSRETSGGFWMSMLAAALMFSATQTLDAASNSLGLGTSAYGGLNMAGGAMVDSCTPTSGIDLTNCGDDNVWQTTSRALVAIVSLFRLAGFIAVVRGLLALHEIGSNKNQTGYSKVFISIIAGTILYNIVPFLVMVTNQVSAGTGTSWLNDNQKVFVPTPY